MSDLQKSLNASSVAETLATYEKWAEKYNSDLDKEGYIAPQLASNYLSSCLGTEIASAKILDAGCGTGLVGESLKTRGATQIDGIDLSPGMLDVAKSTGAYQSLDTADLSQSLSISSDAYDAIICVGTLTQGHVGPVAFDEFVRVAKSGGFIVTTVRENVWQKNGYEDKVKSLISEGKVKLARDDYERQEISKGVFVMFVVLQVL